MGEFSTPQGLPKGAHLGLFSSKGGENILGENCPVCFFSPAIKRLLQILCTLPVTAYVRVKEVSSSLRLLKAYLRSTMEDDHLA